MHHTTMQLAAPVTSVQVRPHGTAVHAPPQEVNQFSSAVTEYVLYDKHLDIFF